MAILKKVSTPAPALFLINSSHSLLKLLMILNVLFTLLCQCLSNTLLKSALKLKKTTSFICLSSSQHLLCSSSFPSYFRSFFPYKGRVPKALRSHVVYIKCRSCAASYVGETCPHLHTRAFDHVAISAFTGKRRTSSPPTSILSHHQTTGHPVTLDDFKMLSSCSFES